MTNRSFFEKTLFYADERLCTVQQAVEREAWQEAERAFGTFLRGHLAAQPAIYKPLSNFIAHTALSGETWKEVAERILDLDLVSCYIRYRFEGEIDWDYNPTPDHFREWTWQLNRHNEFRYLAKAYRETGDERYTRQYLKLILSWIEQEPVPENEPGGATDCWRTIETGLRMSGNWYEALHTFAASPVVSDRDLVTITASIWEHGWRLRHFNTCGNWLFMEMAGLSYVGLLFPFFREAEEWSRYALARLENALKEQLYPDGFQYELTLGYHNVVMANVLEVLDLYRQLKKPRPKEMAVLVHRMAGIFAALSRPDGSLPDINDGRPGTTAELLAEPALLFPQDPVLRFFVGAGEEGTPPAYLSTALPYAGMAVMRTGWEKDAIWCFFEAAPFGFGHQHEDKLEVLLDAYGAHFLTEAGTNAYDDSPLHRYSLSSLGHNTVLVDGCGQNRRSTYSRRDLRVDTPAGMYWRSTAAFDAAQGVYDEGYGEQLLPVKHIRRVLFLKQPEAGRPFLLVIDRMEEGDNRPHEYQVLWHLEDYPICLEKERAVITAPNGSALIWQAAGTDAAELVRGQTRPVYQGWAASWKAEEKRPLPTLIARRGGSGAVRMVTLLYPLPVGAQKPEITLEAGNTAMDEQIRLRIDGRGWVLCESDYFPEYQAELLSGGSH